MGPAASGCVPSLQYSNHALLRCLCCFESKVGAGCQAALIPSGGRNLPCLPIFVRHRVRHRSVRDCFEFFILKVMRGSFSPPRSAGEFGPAARRPRHMASCNAMIFVRSAVRHAHEGLLQENNDYDGGGRRRARHGP